MGMKLTLAGVGTWDVAEAVCESICGIRPRYEHS